MDLRQLLEALSDPNAYPYPVDRVDAVQTHISAVFLAGPYVYKIKKPVNPGFLDFTTLELRDHFCHEEVRLNRRLAADVYLDVVPITRADHGVKVEGPGEIVEWAVKMQRLPESARLQERLRRGEVGTDLVEALARKIALFHRNAETTDRIAAFGKPEMVARIVLDIFGQATPHVGHTVSQGVFHRLRGLTEDTLSTLRPLMERRAAGGVPRDCHGDLHLDHIYFFPERQPPGDLIIIDCIEFNERFRFIDPVADMAFAAMDFKFRGRRDLASVFTDAYFAASGDQEGRALLPLYTAYRATVRGAVEGILLGEREVGAAERAEALARARAHWLLALVELEQPDRRPGLVLVGGLPGTGKSMLARGLAEQAGFRVIRSDAVRKDLASRECVPRVVDALYTREWNERTYAECLRQAGEFLFKGQRVVVDATFREEGKRRLFLDAATSWSVPAVFLACEASPKTVRRRLENRLGDLSDADWAVYLQAIKEWEQPGPMTEPVTHRIATEFPPEAVLARALRVLTALDLHPQESRN